MQYEYIKMNKYMYIILLWCIQFWFLIVTSEVSDWMPVNVKVSYKIRQRYIGEYECRIQLDTFC